MSALTVVTDALQAVPPKVRQGLLVAWALGVVALGVLSIADVDTAWVPEAWLYVGGYLGIQSAANVAPGGGRRIKGQD